MKNSVIVRHNGILHRSFKTHMSHTGMVHMCFSRAQLSKQILERYLNPDEYQEFFANLIFLNIARREGRTEHSVWVRTKRDERPTYYALFLQHTLTSSVKNDDLSGRFNRRYLFQILTNGVNNIQKVYRPNHIDLLKDTVNVLERYLPFAFVKRKHDETQLTDSDSRILFNVLNRSILKKQLTDTVLYKQYLKKQKPISNFDTIIRNLYNVQKQTYSITKNNPISEFLDKTHVLEDEKSDNHEHILQYVSQTKILQKQIENRLRSESYERIKDTQMLLQTNLEEEIRESVQREFRSLEEKIQLQEKSIEEIRTFQAELKKQTEQKCDRKRIQKLEEFFNNDMELERKRYGIQ